MSRSLLEELFTSIAGKAVSGFGNRNLGDSAPKDGRDLAPLLTLRATGSWWVRPQQLLELEENLELRIFFEEREKCG